MNACLRKEKNIYKGSFHEHLEKKLKRPQLNREESYILGGPLTDTEVLNFLKKMKKITNVLALMVLAGFFKSFFRDLGLIISRAFFRNK